MLYTFFKAKHNSVVYFKTSFGPSNSSLIFLCSSSAVNKKGCGDGDLDWEPYVAVEAFNEVFVGGDGVAQGA